MVKIACDSLFRFAPARSVVQISALRPTALSLILADITPARAAQ
jgi:hypothetical protein